MEGRFSAAVQADLPLGLDLTLESEVRLDEGLSRYEFTNVEADLRYNLEQPWVSVSGAYSYSFQAQLGYRYTLEMPAKERLLREHRYHVDTSLLQQFWDDWELEIRLRLQQTHGLVSKVDPLHEPQFRPKIGVTYSLHDAIHPEFAYMLIIPFQPLKDDGIALESQRLYWILNLECGHHQLVPGYFLEASIGPAPRDLLHVLFVEYEYQLW